MPAGAHATPTRVVVGWAHRRRLADLDLGPLSGEERARIDRLAVEAARERSALARVLVRAALADQLAEPPAAFDLDWERGPRLAGRHDGSDLHLSLSHAADRVVVALTRGARIGVDIEDAARGHQLSPDVIRTVTTSAERADLAAVDPDRRAAAAIALWTAKEAVLKATGDGLTIAPRSIELLGLPGAPRLIAHDAHPGLVGASRIVRLGLDPAYAGSLAVLSGAPLDVDEREADPLLDGASSS